MRKVSFQKILVCLILVATFTSCSSLNLGDFLNVDEHVYQTSDISSIKINVSKESVEVNRWESKYIKVITFSEDNNFSINTSENNGTLSITSTKKKSNDSLLIYLPLNYFADEISVETVSGKIDCSYIWAENLLASSVSGNVSLNKIDVDKLEASATSGNVIIENGYVKYPAKLSTISGNLVFEGETSGVDASTISGELCFTNFGELEYNCFFDSISGNINITLMQNSRFNAIYSTVSGQAKNEFTGYNGKANVSENYKNGEISLTCSTISGNIIINKI